MQAEAAGAMGCKMRGPRLASLSAHQHPNFHVPPQARGTPSSSCLTVKDMHTKMPPNYHFQGRCRHSLGFWLLLVFLTDLSLATLLESLPASPEPFSPRASRLVSTPPAPGEMESLVEPTAQTHIPIHLSHLACVLPLSSKPAPAR